MLCRRNPKCQLSMEVFANDKEICMIKLEIQDINDNSPTFPSDQIDIDISENAAPGTRFPLASAHDPDAGENGLKTYQLTRDDYNIFSLDVKSRGDGTKFPELVVERPLDREERSRHTLILTATDGGEYPRSGTIQINVRVTDSNDNSPMFEQSSYVVEIPENSATGKVLIDLNATDLDEGNNGQVVYSFGGYTPDRVRELFSIDSRTGVIKIQGEIDYEESSVIEIDIQAKDLGPNPIPGHCKVTVKVIDRNDNSPSIGFVSVRQGAISEAAPPGTVIALVRVTDKDSGRNGQLQCRVLGNVPFKLEENYDNFFTVVTDRSLDREVQDEYNVTIVAKDNGIPPLNSTKSFTVKILDENDNAPRFPKPVYLLQVPENNIPGEYLGSVQAHDPDLGQNGTTKYFEFKVLAKDSGSPHLESNATVRVSVLDVNDNTPVIMLPLLQNDTAEIHVPRNVGVGHIITTVRAVDNDYGESGRLTYEISDGNDDHLFEIDPVTGEIRTAHPSWEDVSPVVELIVKGEPRINEEQRRWDVSLPLIVTLSIVSIMLLAAMVTIAVKCKRENEIRTYNCRIAEYSHPQLGGKGKKKKINKNDIMLVQSEVEERDSMNVMNVVSSPSLATSPMYFHYQTRLPLSSPRSEVMYLKPAASTLTVPQGHIGCNTSFTSPVTNTTETTGNRMSIIQTDNFPAESNYMGSRQQFVQSNSTFKDPERASLRDSGHGDSDQADSDQDTNKGSCCDMSAKEALKLKATSAKPQPLEQEQEECVNCTDECRVLGHSDRCWMPQFSAGNQAEGSDYRTNVFVPVGMEVAVETEAYEAVSSNGKKTFCTFGKERRDHGVLVANVKPYLKGKRALSPLLQEVPSPSCSPAKTCGPAPCSPAKCPVECGEGSGHYGPPDGQHASPNKHLREPSYLTPDPCDSAAEVGPGGREPLDHGGRPDPGMDRLLQDCRGGEATPVRK
ncbi:hypothetical protein AGOR_G00078180 [Albula goreensis]|uniref:Cadherin domain-containing protein n=1 Tax=Albula goreensis TaxID=1534307 RepID=A0A8T3DPJ2_9TELE|nr:hypothetical protein AGOR_G00078180 [Albula goreensis]